MSWRDAPPYVETFDIAAWLLPRSDAWQEGLRWPTQRATTDLVCAVGRALTFVDSRQAHLEAADSAAQDLRILLRLARELGALDARRHRYISGRLNVAGRMLGGWRKRSNVSGNEPTTATTA